METVLQQAGLSEAQARVYLYILEHGEATPPVIAASLRLTRTNAYKILDRLSDMKLVGRLEADGKTVYRAEDPEILNQLLATEKKRLALLEQSLDETVRQLRPLYDRSAPDISATVIRGQTAVLKAIAQLAGQDCPVRILTSEEARSRIPRAAPKSVAVEHALPAGYTAPVEWSVCGDELVITMSKPDLAAIRIKSAQIADSFSDIWHLLKH